MDDDFVISGYEPAGNGFAVRPVFKALACQRLDNAAALARSLLIGDCIKAALKKMAAAYDARLQPSQVLLQEEVERYLKKGYYCQGDLTQMLKNREVFITDKRGRYLKVFVNAEFRGIPGMAPVQKKVYMNAIKSPA